MLGSSQVQGLVAGVPLTLQHIHWKTKWYGKIYGLCR